MKFFIATIVYWFGVYIAIVLDKTYMVKDPATFFMAGALTGIISLAIMRS